MRLREQTGRSTICLNRAPNLQLEILLEIYQKLPGKPGTELSQNAYESKLAKGLGLVERSKWYEHFPKKFSEIPVGNFGVPFNERGIQTDNK